MALASLKKLAPQARREKVSVDQFIDGANRYAMGQAEIVPLHTFQFDSGSNAALKRATFTLGMQAIQQLSSLSETTGIAKSRLIRIWLDQVTSSDATNYLQSKVK